MSDSDNLDYPPVTSPVVPHNTTVTANNPPPRMTSEIRYNPLNLPRFSGTCPTPKNEASYRVWKHSLDSIYAEETLSENHAKQLIRRSLTGEAAEALITLPPSATKDDIISELDDLYGTPTAKIDGWSLFHAASQKPNESATEWKVRLLRLYQDADPDEKFADHKDKLLCTVYWTNLHSKDLRIATASHRDGKFAALFRYVKENESIYAVKSAKPAKATTSVDDELKKLRKEMESLRLENAEMKKQLQQTKATPRSKSKPKPKRDVVCFYCGVNGHTIYNCPDCPKNASRQGKTRDNNLPDQQ